MAQEDRKPTFILQFHWTDSCDLACRHCYIESTKKEELPTSEVKKVIDDFALMISPFDMVGRVDFTGGDPLMRRDLLEIVHHAAKEKGLDVHILGNPHRLDRSMAIDLRKVGVSTYQQSLDGPPSLHDNLRGQPGLYNNVMRAISEILGVGMRATIQSTLSRLNLDSLLEVMTDCARANVSVYNFSRIVPVGRGSQLANEVISAAEFHEFLLKAIAHADKLKREGAKTTFGVKDCLYSLAYSELGRFKPDSNNRVIYDGCTVGISQLAVLPDGTVYACRRLPIPIGKVPEQKLWDIFMNSSLLNKLREPRNLEYCGECYLVNHCRGCRAVAYATTGNYLAKDPQCWR
jgi:radical SAM protein with 4Fe4S-binding SPASM domain